MEVGCVSVDEYVAGKEVDEVSVEAVTGGAGTT